MAGRDTSRFTPAEHDARCRIAQARRDRTDEDFLDRRDGFYWRTGGTFDIEGPVTR